MLFRALIDRLLGTNDAYDEDDAPTQAALSHLEIPNLMNVIIRLLSPEISAHGLQASSKGTEAVFPALQLLQRAMPPADRLPEVMKAVLQLTESPQWHVRDKAARTYALLAQFREPPREIERSLVPTSSSQNSLHGSLLCAKYIFQKARKHLTGQGKCHSLGSGTYFNRS